MLDRITSKGVDAVERHLRRLDPQGEDELRMLDRLRGILAGERTATPVDRRFYTHEWRESVRYRRAGQPVDEPRDAGATYDLWNDCHTAMPEDRFSEGYGTLFPWR